MFMVVFTLLARLEGFYSYRNDGRARLFSLSADRFIRKSKQAASIILFHNYTSNFIFVKFQHK